MPIHFPVVSKKVNSQLHKRTLTLLDHVVMVVSFLYPLSALPQVIAVFSGQTEGVSVLSWLSFFVCAALFLLYGIRRHVPPMIISNIIWVVMDALVVIGILAAGNSVTWF